ncbi:MAG: cell division ATP-binding protein FtsE [Acutalibacteraceae bacterium]
MIHLKDVSKVYPNGTVALKNISLDIGQGEFVFIVGNSGAGKSTFLKLLIHEESATSGEIVVNGHNLMKIKNRRVPYLRRTMGIVFQDFRLIDKMNVYDNVAFAMRAIGTPEKAIKERVKYVLGLVGLESKEKSRPSELSGGEQQRVSLARALVNNPEMIIADEPTGNIDPKLSHDIINLLSEINKRGTTVIIVTHEHDLVKEFGGRVINIINGKIIEDKKISTKYHPDDDSTYSLSENSNNETAETAANADTEEKTDDNTAAKEAETK